jgi:hypothetical protein
VTIIEISPTTFEAVSAIEETSHVPDSIGQRLVG